MTPVQEQLEAEARELRQILYGPTTDSAWDNMKVSWMNDIVWLRAQVKKEKEHAQKETIKKRPLNPLQGQ